MNTVFDQNVEADSPFSCRDIGTIGMAGFCKPFTTQKSAISVRPKPSRHELGLPRSEKTVAAKAKRKTEVMASRLLREKLVVGNRRGLHMRPVALLVKLAKAFDAEIHIESEQCRANAKSIMGVLALGCGNGKKVTITAKGHDASEAIKKIVGLFARHFDEKESGAVLQNASR